MIQKSWNFHTLKLIPCDSNMSCNIGARNEIKLKTGSVKQNDFDIPVLYTTKSLKCKSFMEVETGKMICSKISDWKFDEWKK